MHPTLPFREWSEELENSIFMNLWRYFHHRTWQHVTRRKISGYCLRAYLGFGHQKLCSGQSHNTLVIFCCEKKIPQGIPSCFKWQAELNRCIHVKLWLVQAEIQEVLISIAKNSIFWNIEFSVKEKTFEDITAIIFNGFSFSLSCWILCSVLLCTLTQM